MSNNQDDIVDDPRCDALRHRLKSLEATPVDLSRLKESIEAEIPRPRRGSASWLGAIRPFQAVAASLLMGAVLVIIIVASSSGPALASPQRMAAIYGDMMTSHSTRNVPTLDEAERLLREEWPEKPSIPGMPTDAAFSCCIHRLDGRKMACIAVDLNGQPVSVAVGRAEDFIVPAGSTRTIGGHEYVIDSADGINMVMTKRDGSWICVMSKIETDQLVAFVAKLAW